MLTIASLPYQLAICRLDPTKVVPDWALQEDFFSITKTDQELSIVCLEQNVPVNIQAQRGWHAFKVVGPLDFSLTGILVSIAQPLAEHKISIFALSTYDTDYILVKKDTFQQAQE